MFIPLEKYTLCRYISFLYSVYQFFEFVEWNQAKKNIKKKRVSSMCVLQQFNLVVLLLQYLSTDIDTFSTKNSLVKISLNSIELVKAEYLNCNWPNNRFNFCTYSVLFSNGILQISPQLYGTHTAPFRQTFRFKCSHFRIVWYWDRSTFSGAFYCRYQ